jgi:hypothetical protein
LRFGETLADPGLVRAAPTIETDPPRREVPQWVLRSLLVSVFVLALLGFLLGRSGGSEREPARNLAAAGPLELRFTSDWELTGPGEPIEGLALADPIFLSLDDENHPAELRAGVAPAAEGALALPPALLGQLDEVPSPETVRLGNVPALRYRSLRHRELDGDLHLYVVPSSRGAVTIACTTRAAAPEDDTGASGAARCEDLATTLELRGAQARSLGPSARYGQAVDAAIASLVQARAPARIALGEAETPAQQRAAARRIADIYRSARGRIQRVAPALVEQPVHRALVAALDSAVGAYGALSRAARDGDPAAFELAKSNVRGAENSFRRALGALGKLGYRVG